MLSKDRFDVVVLGGGVAGSYVAGRLAKRGIRVALLEKSHHPRYAVGESILPQAWRYLDHLGVTPKIEAAGFVQKKGVTAFWGGRLRQFEFSRFGSGRDPLIVERQLFDEILIRHASALGVTVIEDARVTSIERKGDVNNIDFILDEKEMASLSSRILVDATGQSGILSHLYGLRNIDPGGEDISFSWGYFRSGNFVAPGGAIEMRTSVRNTPIQATSYMCETDDGWALQLPLRDQSLFGFSARNSHPSQGSSDRAEKIFLDKLQCIPNFDTLLVGAEYVPGSFRRLENFSFCASSFCGPGFFLIGDAAAYTDPIFAHGVQFAIYSASSAASAIERTLAGKGRQANALFSQQLRRHYEMSRAMARGNLPQTHSARSAIADFLAGMPNGELDLLCTSAAITGRLANFDQMAALAERQAIPNFDYLDPLCL